MLDRHIRPLIDPPLNLAGARLSGLGASPNTVTIFGLVLALCAGTAIAAGYYWLALAFILGSRLADGLDGAVARASEITDFGGYLDVTADYVFYSVIPLAFIVSAPDANGVAGAFLLMSFYINGGTFLGFAILAEKRGLTTEAQGRKSLYYSAGLMEGTETILFFVAMCIFPQWFAPLAWLFGALCLVTAGARVLLARELFGR